MPDFERTVTVPVNTTDSFQFLSTPENLPTYVAEMVLARPEEGDRLRVAADVQGRHEEGDARYRTDPSAHRIEWDAEGSDEYRGWLQVSEDGSGSSIRIHLHVPHERDEAQINRALDETVSNIERLLSPGQLAT